MEVSYGGGIIRKALADLEHQYRSVKVTSMKTTWLTLTYVRLAVGDVNHGQTIPVYTTHYSYINRENHGNPVIFII